LEADTDDAIFKGIANDSNKALHPRDNPWFHFKNPN